MQAIKKISPGFLSASSIVAMFVLWLAFAPTQAGGLASYIIVVGNSMEPKFHIGDLVIAHQEPSYQIGDAVVYRNRGLENFVFHRILDEDMGRYKLQGDNNDWVDTYEPVHEEIIGKLWLHIPRGGRVIEKIRHPYTMALIAAGLGAVLANSLFESKTKGNKTMNNKSARARSQEWLAAIKQGSRDWLAQVTVSDTNKPSGSDSGSLWDASFFALGLILLSSLIIGIISFSRPTSRLVQDDIEYQHLGIFSYLASAPQSVYDENIIQSGDPIFPRLTCSVDVNLQYTLIAPDAQNVTGTYQLRSVIREEISGWQRSIPLQEETSFSGSTFGTTAKLDLCKIESLTQSMEKETDFHPGSYTLSIMPDVKIQGDLNGRSLDGRFDSSLNFLYDRVHFYIIQSEDVANPLSLTETDVLQGTQKESNTVAFLGTEISVLVLRWLAVIGLAVSLAGFSILAVKLGQLSATDKARFFRVRHEALIVDIYEADSLRADSIDVLSMDALSKLAERFNAVILHVENNSAHEYFVQAGGTTYRFLLPAGQTETVIPAETMQREIKS